MICEFHEPELVCIHCLGDEIDRLRKALESVQSVGDRAAVMVANDALADKSGPDADASL